jgi:uncharacterized protein (DUF779 family)
MLVTPRAACAGTTVRAQRLLERVRRAASDDTALVFLISGGCCGGTSPVLCRRDAVLDGFDVALGEAGGLPVFAHPEHARYLEQNHFVIDALDDVRSDTFSLEAAHGGRFVLRELSRPERVGVGQQGSPSSESPDATRSPPGPTRDGVSASASSRRPRARP